MLGAGIENVMLLIFVAGTENFASLIGREAIVVRVECDALGILDKILDGGDDECVRKPKFQLAGTPSLSEWSATLLTSSKYSSSEWQR